MNNVIHIYSYCRDQAVYWRNRYDYFNHLAGAFDLQGKTLFAENCRKKAMEVRREMIAFSKKARQFRERGELIFKRTYDTRISY